jgi:formate dehydrogenase maturation protein FdhE
MDLHSLDSDQLEALLDDLNAERIRRAERYQERKRQRDAERHMDVHCPACGAQPRTRCLQDGKRVEVSHPERAWKMRACPACGASPGEWCKVGPVNVTRAA